MILHVKYGGSRATWFFDDFITPFYHYSSRPFSFSVVFSFTEVTLISIIPLPLLFVIPHTHYYVTSCSCSLSTLPSLSYVLSLSFGLGIQACRSLSLTHSRHSLRPFLVFLLQLSNFLHIAGDHWLALFLYHQLAYTTLHSASRPTQSLHRI